MTQHMIFSGRWSICIRSFSLKYKIWSPVDFGRKLLVFPKKEMVEFGLHSSSGNHVTILIFLFFILFEIICALPSRLFIDFYFKK